MLLLYNSEKLPYHYIDGFRGKLFLHDLKAEEIINKVHKMKSSEMLKINRKELYPDGRFKKYKKSKKPFKITTIIKTLFEVNGFEPIKLNQIYDNMGCFEEIIEDNSLDYDTKLCTRRII